MKKLFLLCVLSIFFLINCKNQNTLGEQNLNSNQEVGFKELICNGKSILERFNSKLFYDFDHDFDRVKKYSIELIAKPINAEIVNISVQVDSIEATQKDGYTYICNLMDGVNTIIITITSKKEPLIKREYKIKISKATSNVPNAQSSKLKEIRADDIDILSKFKKHICELSDVTQTKNEISLYVTTHNQNATIIVKDYNGVVTASATNTYKVRIDYGKNILQVLVNSEAEGELLYRIIVYREEELCLKSFKIENIEYCDENTGLLTKKSVQFKDKSTRVRVIAKNPNTIITFKHNGKEIKTKDNFYNLELKVGRNGIEVIVSGKDGIRNKVYTILFVKISPTISGLIKLDADGDDLIHLFSTSKCITLSPRQYEKSTLKLEVLATSNITIKVKLETNEVDSANGVYNIELKEGNNNVVVNIYDGEALLESYFIFVKRYIKEEVAKNPEPDEVEVTFELSDGVNGSAVDGSYINISKTHPILTPETPKRILVKDGKAKTNLKKDTFYDFKVDGRNDKYDIKKYAASNVISYYIGNETKVVSIVQRPMQKITKRAIAPVVDSLKFGTETVVAGKVLISDIMKKINMDIITVAPVEKLRFSTPLPMLAIGFVPSTNEDSEVIEATIVQDSTKFGDGWKSTYSWDSNTLLTSEEDAVIVVYDVASNRLEYHLRIKPSNIVVATEDNEISIIDMAMKFERLPTSSQIYSVGQDEGTKNSSHYTANISFEVKRNDEAIFIKCFELYRKCIEDGGEFRCIKKVIYNSPKNQTHRVYDSDGLLEDKKTYQYKVVAYTTDNKRSLLDKSDELSLKVPKSTSLLLEYPVNRAITPTEAKNLNYVFKFSNSEILKNASEIRAGFLISDRVGKVLHSSKFRYVFNDKEGKPSIYFAKESDAILTSNGYYGTRYSIDGKKIVTNIDDIISVDQEKGIVKIKKDFFILTEVNLIDKTSIKYVKGQTYYWDILDYGLEEYRDSDDKPCMIIQKPSSNVTIISYVNDDNNGNNAWNGRAEFSLNID